jgi:hypothetical protein
VTGTYRPFRVRDDHLSGETNPLGRGIIVTEARSSNRPPEEQAVEAAPESVQRKAQERLAPGYQIESQRDSHAIWMTLWRAAA